jgi:hypothetical protein
VPPSRRRTASRRRTRSPSSRSATSAADGAAALEALERAFAPLGLNVLLPLSPAAFDAACAPVSPGLRLGALRAGAQAALVVGSGGPGFFARFGASAEAHDGLPNPLDRFTRRAVEVRSRRRSDRWRRSWPRVPVRRRASDSVPAPGVRQAPDPRVADPPRVRPWWAYRALVLVDVELPAPPPATAAGCPALRGRLPGGRGPRTALDPDCTRLEAGLPAIVCRADRLHPRAEHAYSAEGLAFHMGLDAETPTGGLWTGSSLPRAPWPPRSLRTSRGGLEDRGQTGRRRRPGQTVVILESMRWRCPSVARRRQSVGRAREEDAVERAPARQARPA